MAAGPLHGRATEPPFNLVIRVPAIAGSSEQSLIDPCRGVQHRGADIDLGHAHRAATTLGTVPPCTTPTLRVVPAFRSLMRSGTQYLMSQLEDRAGSAPGATPSERPCPRSRW